MKGGIAIDTLILIIIGLVAAVLVISMLVKGFGGFKRSAGETMSTQECNAMCENLRTIAARYDNINDFCNDNKNLITDYKNKCKIRCRIDVGSDYIIISKDILQRSRDNVCTNIQ